MTKVCDSKEKTLETLVEKSAAYKIGGEHMTEAIIDVERELKAILPDPFKFTFDRITFTMNYTSSNIGDYGSAICYVAAPDYEYDNPILRPIPESWREAGGSFFLHNDFNVPIKNASRQNIKFVARGLPAFIKALCRHLETEHVQMAKATATLRKMLEAVSK